MTHSKRPRRLNYSVNKKGPIGGWKVWNAIKHYQKLSRRMKIEWETLWLSNAFAIVEAKLKKYWINLNSIENA